MMVGFAIALRFPGQIGRVVLVVAGAGTLLGELIGPFALRRALARVGEIPQARDNAVVVSPPSGEATS
jgi:pimeloyl-ACP methyl ester carboxylesterase